MAVYVARMPIVSLWQPASIMIARRSTRAVYGRETRVLEGNGCRTRRLHTVATKGERALLTRHPLTIARHSGRWQSCSRLMTGGRWAGNSWPLRLHDCLYSRACVVDVHRMCFEWPIDDCSSIIQNTHTGVLTAYTHSNIGCIHCGGGWSPCCQHAAFAHQACVPLEESVRCGPPQAQCVGHSQRLFVCTLVLAHVMYRHYPVQGSCRKCGRTMAVLHERHEQLNCTSPSVLHTIIRAADLAHPPAVVDQLYSGGQARTSISTRFPCHILFAAGLERQATIMALLWPGHFASAT